MSTTETSLSTVICLLTFRYLLFSIPNLIYNNYTVLGNSWTIKSLYFTFWMHLSAPVQSSKPQVLSPLFYRMSKSPTGLINHLLHFWPTSTQLVHFPTVRPTFGHLVNTFSTSFLLPEPSLTCLGPSLGTGLSHLRLPHISWLFHHSQDCCSTIVQSRVPDTGLIPLRCTHNLESHRPHQQTSHFTSAPSDFLLWLSTPNIISTDLVVSLFLYLIRLTYDSHTVSMLLFSFHIMLHALLTSFISVQCMAMLYFFPSILPLPHGCLMHHFVPISWPCLMHASTSCY